METLIESVNAYSLNQSLKVPPPDTSPGSEEVAKEERETAPGELGTVQTFITEDEPLPSLHSPSPIADEDVLERLQERLKHTACLLESTDKELFPLLEAAGQSAEQDDVSYQCNAAHSQSVKDLLLGMGQLDVVGGLLAEAHGQVTRYLSIKSVLILYYRNMARWLTQRDSIYPVHSHDCPGVIDDCLR
jgi:hypothetical protein